MYEATLMHEATLGRTDKGPNPTNGTVLALRVGDWVASPCEPRTSHLLATRQPIGWDARYGGRSETRVTEKARSCISAMMDPGVFDIPSCHSGQGNTFGSSVPGCTEARFAPGGAPRSALGHTAPAITLRRYAHGLTDMQDDAGRRMGYYAF